MRRAILALALALSVVGYALAQPKLGGQFVNRTDSFGYGSWVTRPLPKDLTAAHDASSCGMVDLNDRVLDAEGQWAGTTRYIFVSAEGAVASTDTAGDHACVSPPCALTYRRYASTSAPVACPAGSPCNTLKDWTGFHTCYHSTEANGRKGLSRGDNLALDAAGWNANAATYRGATATKPTIGLAVRWDLLTPNDMQLSGFQPSFLLEAATGQTLGDFTTWMEADTSLYCGAGSDCTWNDSTDGWTSEYRDRDLGFRYKDMIDDLGSTNDYKKYIYYLTRPSTAKPLNPDGVLTDMSNDAYLTWRIAHIKALLTQIDLPNVMVQFGDKLSQHYDGSVGRVPARNSTFDYSVRGRCPTVTDFLWTAHAAVRAATPDHAATSPYQTACHGNPYPGGDAYGSIPREGGYTGDAYGSGLSFEQYVLNLKKLSDALVAAGVPYIRETAGAEFSAAANDYWDADGSATDIDAVLRGIVMNASAVVLTTNNAEYRGATVAAIRGKIPYFTSWEDPACGDGVKTTGEACDDGNTTSGDGCSSTCQMELALSACLIGTCEIGTGEIQ